jgi:hypothetical protein
MLLGLIAIIAILRREVNKLALKKDGWRIKLKSQPSLEETWRALLK